MSIPTISGINPELNINRQDGVNMIVTSIGMEDISLAHTLNAEIKAEMCLQFKPEDTLELDNSVDEE